MSLAAVATANAAPTWTQEPPHEAADRGAGSKFSAVLSTLENETTQVEASSKGASADGTSAASAATSGDTAKAPRVAALDVALAQLVSDAVARGVNAPSTSPSGSSKTTSGGATSNAPKSRSAPLSDASAAAEPSAAAVGAASGAASASAEFANLSATAAKSRADDSTTDSAATADSLATAPTTLVASGLGASAVAAFASGAAAATATGASVAKTARNSNGSGGDSPPGATSAMAAAGLVKGAGADSATSTLRDIFGGDSSLFVSAVESRSYLGLDVASGALAATTSAVASAAAVTSAAAITSAAAVAAAATEAGDAGRGSSSSTATASEGAPATGKRAGLAGDAQAGGATASAATGESANPVAGKSSSAKSGDSSNGGDSSGGGAPSPVSTTSASATSVASDLAGGFSASVSLDQLPGVIAGAADDLSAAAQSASGPAAAGASNAQPIKELQINLAPAELGSLQVTMRLVDGKLSVVVEVAQTSTLQAIAGDRDAIATRLGSASAPLESLVVQPMRAPATAGADSNGDAQPGTQDNPSNGANRDSPAGRQSTSQRDGAADAWRQSASARRGAGDLTV